MAAASPPPCSRWLSGIQGLAIGTGRGAAGLTIGPFAGRLLAELTTGRTPSLDLAPFAPGRQPVVPSQEPAALR